MRDPFKNHPLTDFSAAENREAMTSAINDVASRLGRTYDLIIGGRHLQGPDTFSSFNPSQSDEVVGIFQKADEATAEQALEAALEAFETWKHRPVAERADYLFRTAEVMRRRQNELSAWMVYEVGKSWAEADGDVAEAIDFLEFYAREAIRYSEPQPLTPYPTEKNEFFYIPLGVGVVIPPWNFPLAILVGMTSASFVAGNTVVLKPSSDSPAIAAQFMEILEEVGLPPGVVNFVTGPGAIAGEVLVKHPKTRFITFTGSMEVGLRINELAAKTAPGQIWIKRVVAEMGGKDSIVVDETADLDSAADGIVASAFGLQGQKCSACSRAILVDDIYDALLEKIVEKTKAITVGPVKDPSNTMGPVVNGKAKESILAYIETGKGEGRLVCGGEALDLPGHFIAPTVIADVPPKAVISQEEIFGPVLAVFRAADFEEATEIFNNTIYGLTGALYSTSRERIERARRDFHVGNLYFNRKCTAALVDVHPFGGFNMSGTDSKAGGRDYLLLFLQGKSVSEKI